MASGLWSVYGALSSQRRAAAAGAAGRADAAAPLPPCTLVLLSCGLRLLVVPGWG
jgi:hypothetical protein